MSGPPVNTVFSTTALRNSRRRVLSVAALALSFATAIVAGACTDAKPSPPPPPPSSTTPVAVSKTTPSKAVSPTASPAKPAVPLTTEIDPASGLLKVKDYELVVASCTACHSAKIIAQNSGDREYWLSLIRWMQKTQGLWPIAPPMEDKILTYLSTAYGAKKKGRRPPLAASLLPPSAPAPLDDAAVMKARAAIGVAKTKLKGALMAGMKAGGPIAAIPMCKAQAPSLTQGTAKVHVGRTSHRLRNPANAGPAWATSLATTLRHSPDIPYLTTTLPNGSVGYVEPIPTGAVCLKCHGTKLSPAAAISLAENYPDDEATGFSLGEMRGVFWAEVMTGSGG